MDVFIQTMFCWVLLTTNPNIITGPTFGGKVIPVLAKHGELKSLKLFINLLKDGIQLTKHKSEQNGTYS